MKMFNIEIEAQPKSQRLIKLMLRSVPLTIKSVRICAWFDRFFNFYLAVFGGNNGLTQPWHKGTDNANL